MKILDLYVADDMSHNSTGIWMMGVTGSGFWAGYNRVLQNAYNCDGKLVFGAYHQGIVYGPVSYFCNAS